MRLAMKVQRACRWNANLRVKICIRAPSCGLPAVGKSENALRSTFFLTGVSGLMEAPRFRCLPAREHQTCRVGVTELRCSRAVFANRDFECKFVLAKPKLDCVPPSPCDIDDAQHGVFADVVQGCVSPGSRRTVHVRLRMLRLLSL